MPCFQSQSQEARWSSIKTGSSYGSPLGPKPFHGFNSKPEECLFFLLHRHLPKLYVDYEDAENLIDNIEVVSIASQLLIAAAIFQLSDSTQVIVLGALRGLQDVKIPTLITFVSYWLIGFPISWYLGKEDAYGSFGIWLGLLAGLSTAAIFLYIRFNYLTKKLILSNN